MQPFTACIICKNEETHIGECLKALQAYQIPVVVTDTGSTDQTIPIVEAMLTAQDKLCHFAWCDHFSKAKNYCAMQADTDWIWFIDADEILTSCSLKAIESFVKNPANAKTIGVVQLKSLYTMQGEKTYITSNEARIYHRRHYHYEGSIHEQLTLGETELISSSHSAMLSGFEISQQDSSKKHQNLPAYFDHLGYEAPEILARKCKRNIALLEVAYQDNADPYLAYQLGSAYSTLGDHATAIRYFQEGLGFDLDPALYYVQRMVESYGYSLLEQKEYAMALSFEGIYDAFSKTADFVFLMGLIYMNNARFEQAIAQFEKATTFSTCGVEGVNSYRAKYNEGVILECTHRIKEALICYQACGDFAPAKNRILVLTGENTNASD